MFKTDMNERERARFAEMLRDFIKEAEECAAALELEDDMKFILHFIALDMGFNKLANELRGIILATARKAAAETKG